nr:hypothetical protein [Tanacetum cinerariifolium]
MRLRDCASWDWGHMHMGCWGVVWNYSGKVRVYEKGSWGRYTVYVKKARNVVMKLLGWGETLGLAQPMRLRDCASWDSGHMHMGCWGVVWNYSGKVRVYEKGSWGRYTVYVKKAGNVVMKLLGWGETLGLAQVWSLGFWKLDTRL